MESNSMNIIGSWTVIKSEFKVPGWHTNIIGSIYEFKSDGYLIIKSNYIVTSKSKYSTHGEIILIKDVYNNDIEYPFKINNYILEIENKIVKIQLIKN